jgi:hypothetical protein
MKLVSANSVGSEKVFLAGSWSFMYITKRKGTEINPWGTDVLLLNLRKHFEFNYIVLLCFCFVSVR